MQLRCGRAYGFAVLRYAVMPPVVQLFYKLEAINAIMPQLCRLEDGGAALFKLLASVHREGQVAFRPLTGAQTSLVLCEVAPPPILDSMTSVSCAMQSCASYIISTAVHVVCSWWPSIQSSPS